MAGLKKFIEYDFLESKDRTHPIKSIRKLFDLYKATDYTIDDLTWDDLNMDNVFYNMDRTYTTAGESALYSMLRNPFTNKEGLLKRSKYINEFRQNRKLCNKIRYWLFNMGFDSKNALIDTVTGLLTVSRFKFIIYTLLGQILPLVCILLGLLFKEPNFMFGVLVLTAINIGIDSMERRRINDMSLIHLRRLLICAKKISKIDNTELSPIIESIKTQLDKLKGFSRDTIFLAFITRLGGVFEFLSIPFLLEISTYYKISGKISENQEDIIKLYYLVGEVDALISMASFIESNKDTLCTPNFIEDVSINIESGIHPLLKKPVANSINISNKGIVLTGTNMSGKSTFLRMVTNNILFAQCFNICFAKGYTGSFFNIVSSVSIKDDISSGKSYYMAEAESMLRIINALDLDMPVFCAIDEIFRGTNPTERIASSCEILNYINRRNAICIVTTHDRELTSMLKDTYSFYHFSESVEDSKGLSFDYKLKSGISNTKNAIKLLDYIGYPKEIIDAAYIKANKLEHYN